MFNNPTFTDNTFCLHNVQISLACVLLTKQVLSQYQIYDRLG